MPKFKAALTIAGGVVYLTCLAVFMVTESSVAVVVGVVTGTLSYSWWYWGVDEKNS